LFRRAHAPLAAAAEVAHGFGVVANIALDPLDKELESRRHKFARYADDFIVLVKSANAAKRVLASLTRY
jgi:RNA-directed DNA polymerase